MVSSSAALLFDPKSAKSMPEKFVSQSVASNKERFHHDFVVSGQIKQLLGPFLELHDCR